MSPDLTPDEIAAILPALEVAALSRRAIGPADNAIRKLKMQRTLLCRPTIRFAPCDGDEDYLWLVDGRVLHAPRRTTAVWAYWMALRDGWSMANWVRHQAKNPAESIRNSRQPIARWLEREGFPRLAGEILRCSVHNDGRIIYSPDQRVSPLIVFEVQADFA